MLERADRSVCFLRLCSHLVDGSKLANSIYICKSKSLSLFYVMKTSNGIACPVRRYFCCRLFSICAVFRWRCLCHCRHFISIRSDMECSAFAFMALKIQRELCESIRNRLLYVLTTSIKSTHLMFKWIPMVHFVHIKCSLHGMAHVKCNLRMRKGSNTAKYRAN